MKVAIYPGSFNPWHEGHSDIVSKALQVFDLVVIAQGINPDKKLSETNIPSVHTYGQFGNKVTVAKFNGLLTDFISHYNSTKDPIVAVIRGLRNGQDLEYEKTQQYWNEDLGIIVPTVCFITDRKLVHISSSAIRAVNKFKKEDM